MSLLDRLRQKRDYRRRETRLEAIRARFADYTMIPPSTYIDNLRLAERVSEVRGAVVECGVWRGGMTAGLATVLGPQRTYYLFDSFEGLPPATDIDGAAALAWQRNTNGENYHNNCSAAPEYADRAMRLAGVISYHLVPGWFNETLPRFELSEPIALLRLDGDWYESTMVCLEHLFRRVAPNGLIVLDDYYAWDGCSRALHDFLSRTKAVERIHDFHGICYLRKAASPAHSPSPPA